MCRATPHHAPFSNGSRSPVYGAPPLRRCCAAGVAGLCRRSLQDRGIPVDIIIIDWMHWKTQGDWHFDAEYWPDPSAMVAEIATLNMSVMVTVWPFSFNGSLSYDTLKRTAASTSLPQHRVHQHRVHPRATSHASRTRWEP